MALASGSRVESGPMRLFLPLVQAAEAKCIELAMAACIAKLRSKVCRPRFLRIDYARADRRFTSLALSGYHFPRSRFQHLTSRSGRRQNGQRVLRQVYCFCCVENPCAQEFESCCCRSRLFDSYGWIMDARIDHYHEIAE